MKDHRNCHEKPDQLDYLRELVAMYDEHLLNNNWSYLHEHIFELRKSCLLEIRKLLEIDIEAHLLATSVPPFAKTRVNC